LVPSQRPAPPEIELELEIEIGEAAEALRAGTARLVDVRDEWEFRRRRVPGALLVPLGQLPQRAAGLPRDERLLVICEHGERSLVAAEYLRRVGFDGAASIRGGTSAWARGDRPMEQG
jgi:rhodanese-related sulfurtransferase